MNTNDFYCDYVLNNKIPVIKVKETDRILAFHHTKPSYDYHVVIVPKTHIESLTDVDDMSLIQEVFEVAQHIIDQKGFNSKNFRIITNGGSFQDSKHLHFHLISGNKK